MEMEILEDVVLTVQFHRRTLRERHQHVHRDPVDVDPQTRALINRMLRKNDLQRNKPNILITGTPGTGKSTIARKLCEKIDLQHVDVSAFAMEHKCYIKFDEELQSAIIEENKVLDLLEPLILEGGKVLDFHGCEVFPEKWLDAAFVLRTDNTILYDRLIERGYSAKKLQNNVEAEIFQTLLEEARDCYDPKIVHELRNDTNQHVDKNVETIQKWYKKWKRQQDKENN